MIHTDDTVRIQVMAIMRSQRRRHGQHKISHIKAHIKVLYDISFFSIYIKIIFFKSIYLILKDMLPSSTFLRMKETERRLIEGDHKVIIELLPHVAFYY